MGSCYQTRPNVLSKTRLDNERHWLLPRTSLLEETIQMRWRKLVNAIITTPVNDKYRPDPKRWVCIFPAFVHSRFLICKHLVQAVQRCCSFPPSKKESYLSGNTQPSSAKHNIWLYQPHPNTLQIQGPGSRHW
jgi:hypothetical protein